MKSFQNSFCQPITRWRSSMVWIEPRTHTPCVVPQHRSVGSQDDINNDDNDVSNDVNASLCCRVIDDYLSFGCDWSHAMYLVNYIYKFSGNSHDRPVQGRVGQLSSLLIRAVDKLYCSSNGNLPLGIIWTTKRKFLLIST